MQIKDNTEHEARESVLRFIGWFFDEARGPEAACFDTFAASCEILEMIEAHTAAFHRNGYLIFNPVCDPDEDCADPQGEADFLDEAKPTPEPDFIGEDEDTGIGAPREAPTSEAAMWERLGKIIAEWDARLPKAHR